MVYNKVLKFNYSCIYDTTNISEIVTRKRYYQLWLKKLNNQSTGTLKEFGH